MVQVHGLQYSKNRDQAFQTAFGPHAGALMEDIPNYTDIQPTIQISEVKI